MLQPYRLRYSSEKTIPKIDMNNTEQLTQLLLKQRGFLRAVWEATEEEARLLALGRPMKELLPLLKRKGVLVACIEDLNKQILRAKDSLPKTSHNAEGLEVDVKELFQKIFCVDFQNQVKLKELKTNQTICKNNPTK